MVNELFKSFVVTVIIIVCWSLLCFGGGYLLCDRIATERIDRANQQLEQQQQRIDELIRSSNERVQKLREELRAKVQANGEAARELSKLVDQIREQKLDI